ncbi:MAG: aldehyde ferredoxin oxidoreductase family protein [Thermodesulfobacteriota bacterium]
MTIGQIRGGLAGKILKVDLSTRKIQAEETEAYAKEFIGGRAINSFILFNELERGIQWSDSKNLLIFGAGALVGTLTPGACRVSIETKNVFNNGKGSANVGGHFGPELKYAGFDHIVISGKSDRPVYLWIESGRAELRDAKLIWGKTTFETEEMLEKEHGFKKIRVASIGPAGENLVRGSGIVCDRAKVAGGSGVGCVMGDKKLKAVVVCGQGGSIKVAEPDRFFQAVDIALKKVGESPLSEMMKKITLAGRWSDPKSANWDYLISARNGQDDFWEIEKRVKLTNQETGFPKYRKSISACFMCPVGCMPFSEINEGPFKGTRGEGFWSNTVMDAVRLDITDPQGVIKAWILANELGLDTDFATSVISWAFECYEKGLLTEKDTDGLKLEWGDVNAFIEMLKKLAYRQGIGDFLAQGVKAASEQLGRGSEQFAIHVKGQDSIEPFRVPKGWALGVATSPVAGRHLRGTSIGGTRFGPPNTSFNAHTSEDQPKYVVWQSLTKEMEDMLGICVYVGTWSGAYALEPSDYVALTNGVMGTDLTEEDLFLIARRSYNLEKAFNTLHTDFDRKDDYPPKRFMEEPVKSGPYKGFRCEKENWDKMLDQFYELQGWDRKTGLQTRTSLIKLGMENVAQRLEKAGRLIH